MNSLRLIGGQWRRRILRFAEAEGLRPTPDRVRETLFNWLGQDLAGRTCLDLFAGSGALGFEAASRGAARVLMVDHSPKVIACLEKNARLLEGENYPNARVQIIRANAVKFASSYPSAGLRFDVLFLDPPYQQGLIEKIAPFLPALMAPDGVIYAEAEYALTDCGAWQTVRSGRAGQVFYHLMRKQTP